MTDSTIQLMVEQYHEQRQKLRDLDAAIEDAERLTNGTARKLSQARRAFHDAETALLDALGTPEEEASTLAMRKAKEDLENAQVIHTAACKRQEADFPPAYLETQQRLRDSDEGRLNHLRKQILREIAVDEIQAISEMELMLRHLRRAFIANPWTDWPRWLASTFPIGDGREMGQHLQDIQNEHDIAPE